MPKDPIGPTSELRKHSRVEHGRSSGFDSGWLNAALKRPSTGLNAPAARGKVVDWRAKRPALSQRDSDRPRGYANWSLRLLARKVVELQIVDAVSYETVRAPSKKRHDEPENRVLGHSAGG